jgi:hypothetical protein
MEPAIETGYALSNEELRLLDLVRHARRAEEAGFYEHEVLPAAISMRPREEVRA